MGKSGIGFETHQGLKQGDNLSPNLFSLFANGLNEELECSKISVKFNDLTVSVLACADDLVLMAPTQAGLQQLINITEGWCRKWRLQINRSTDKMKIMHVRSPRTKETTYEFKCGGTLLELVKTYKYLVFLLSFDCNVACNRELLAKAGECTLGSMIAKVKRNGDVRFET